MDEENDQNDSVNEGAGLPAAEAEPSDSDLLKIIGGGEPRGTKPTKKPKAKADDEELDETGDDDEADPDSEDSDDGDGEAKADDDADEGDEADDAQDENDESEAPADDDDADDAAGDDDPDAALDDEDRKVRAKFTPEQQAKFDKAVSKKTRRILELKTELREEQEAREAAETRAAEIEKGSGSAAIAPTADNPLADIDDEAKLDVKLSEARTHRRFALANPDGAFVNPKTGEVVEVEDPENPPEGVVRFTKKRIGEILADTEETLQEHGPKHRKFLQDRTAGEAAAVKEFPWLKQKNSAGTVAVETTLRHAPALRSIPGIKMLLADAFIGRAVRLGAKQQQAAKGKPGAGKDVKKAPPSPGRGAPPPKGDAKKKVAGNALKTLADTGDDPGDAALRALIR